MSKGEQVDGHDVHRLIMNLIPLNNICRGIQGDVATLPAWSSSGPLFLMPSQQLLITSEDVKCFFYIFRVPQDWHRFLGFNKVVNPRFHPGKAGRHVLVAKVLPMGFKNSEFGTAHPPNDCQRCLTESLRSSGRSSRVEEG